jgi:HEAT repeat protein
VNLLYLVPIAAIVAAWFLFSAWVVASRVVYDRRLRAVRDGRGGRLSWRALARMAADSSSDTELADSLTRYALARDAKGVVAAATGRSKGWRRVEALRILARAGHPIGVSELRRMLSDRKGEVVATAATILAEIPGGEATSLLVGGLVQGGSQTRWIAALLEPRGVPATRLRPLLNDSRLDVREAALRLLGSATEPDEWIDRKLEQHCGDPLPDVRAAAARALGRRTRAPDATIGGLVRAVSARALGRTEASAAEATLIRLLGDPVWFVQVQAARALGRLGCTGSAQHIASLLASSEWWVRQAAKESLVELGTSVSDDLVQLLEHPDPFARNSLAEVLQDLGLVDRLVADVEAEPPMPGSRSSEQTLRRVLAAGGPSFAEAVLSRMQPQSRARFSSVMAAAEHETSPEVQAA